MVARALVESIAFNRRVVGSTPALAAMYTDLGQVLYVYRHAVAYALRSETPIQYISVLYSRERLWVLEDLKGRYYLEMAEWMHEWMKVWSYHPSTEVWSLSIKVWSLFIPHSVCIITAHFCVIISRLIVCLLICLIVRLNVCLAVGLIVSLPVGLSLWLPVCVSFCLSVCLFVLLSLCLCCLSIYLFFSLYVCLSVCLTATFLFLYVCLLVFQPACLYVLLFVPLPLCRSLCLPICESFCWSVCLLPSCLYACVPTPYACQFVPLHVYQPLYIFVRLCFFLLSASLSSSMFARLHVCCLSLCLCVHL